ncbi:MAG TPA: Ldh family oxidoreductase [Dehalococcoidia bacterium]|nr:Ldh family oxidoreductase [Dehalococcoidia bacterium]
MADEGDIRVDPDRLHALGVRALVCAGVPEEHARWTADVLLTSDLRGIESHGFARFADFYVNRARQGLLNVNPRVRVVQETASAATVDGDGGLGFVASTIAMRLAIQKARETGVGMVSVRNSTHHGPASPYALMAVPENMIGISMTTGGNGVVPPGGSKRAYGLNAMSVAAPMRPPQAPWCLDMATSVVAAGKFEIARRRGKPVPEGWAIDGEGKPIMDPLQYYNPERGGGILPLGSYIETGAWKGFGLAIMVDILTGILSGGHSSAELPQRAANHFFGALRIDAFTTIESFYDQMDSMKATLRAAPRLPGAGPLTFAGEPEAEFEADCRKHGIPYHPSIIESLRKMCADLGIEFDLDLPAA